MEKKKKIIKSIICILTALLIAGCFIAMAFMPKIFETNSASAENQNVTNPPTQVSNIFDITGHNNSSYTASQQIIYAENTKNNNDSYIALYFKNNKTVNINRYKEIEISYTAYSNTDKEVMYVEYGYNDGKKEIKIAQSWLQYTGFYKNQNIKMTDLQFGDNKSRIINYIKIQYAPIDVPIETANSWIQIYKLIFIDKSGTADTSKAPYYISYLDNILQGAHDKGYNNGYQIGHNAGYQEGYDSGVTNGWKSPIEIFIKPVDMFLSTNIFGNISIGDILSIILFVMVGIIFIKMFAGG